MKNLTRHTGKLKILQRLPNSHNGNPRYLLEIDGVECRTAVDSDLAYGMKDLDGKYVTANIGTHYNAATVASLKPASPKVVRKQTSEDWS